MRYPSIAATLAFGLACVSCGSNATDPGGRLTGGLTGFVQLRAIDGAIMGDQSGVTVTVEGTAYGTTSKPDGSWHIDNLPTGTYTISLSSPGFGRVRTWGYQFTGGGEAFFTPSVVLTRMSTAHILSLGASTDPRNYPDTIPERRAVTITATFSEPVTRIMAFFNSSPSIRPDSGRYNATAGRVLPPNTSINNEIIVWSHELEAAGYKSGDTVYMALYTVGAGITQYDDPWLRKRIYSGALPEVGSNVVSFTMP